MNDAKLYKESRSFSRMEGNLNLDFNLTPHSLAAITLEFETKASEKITERR
jgi:hypothetical protein